MEFKKNPRIGSANRARSGKKLRQVLGTTVYAWCPIPPDFNGKINTIKDASDKRCCDQCNGVTVDNCVTYVYGGRCFTAPAAYVDCDYVV